MRRRCNGRAHQMAGRCCADCHWTGVLLACLIPKCVFLIGMGFVGAGGMAHQSEQKMLILLYFYIRKKAVLFKIKKNGFYHSLGIRLRV